MENITTLARLKTIALADLGSMNTHDYMFFKALGFSIAKDKQVPMGSSRIVIGNQTMVSDATGAKDWWSKIISKFQAADMPHVYVIDHRYYKISYRME